MTPTMQEMLEALKPFADYVDGTLIPEDAFPITNGSGMARRQLTVGDCKRAREVYRALLPRAGEGEECGRTYNQSTVQQLRRVEAAPPSPALEAEPVAKRLNDSELRKIWRDAGGEFYGPRVETGSMPEAKLLPFLRALTHPPASQPAQAVDREAALEVADRIRAQNWKNGGVLAMDRDEAADAIVALLGGQQ